MKSHCLGVAHEHTRPDHDTYLNLDMDASTKADQYYVIEAQNWLDTGMDAYRMRHTRYSKIIC